MQLPGRLQGVCTNLAAVHSLSSAQLDMGKGQKSSLDFVGPQKFLLLATSYHTAACQYHKHIYIIFWCTTIIYWCLAIVSDISPPSPLHYFDFLGHTNINSLLTDVLSLHSIVHYQTAREMLLWAKLYNFTANDSTYPSES